MILSNGPSYPRAQTLDPLGIWSRLKSRTLRCFMSAVPVLWIVWAGVAAIMLILLGYRGTLTRYEEDQIFLDDCEDHQKKEQTALLAKVEKIQPYVRASIAATCVVSACVIGYYVWDAIRHLS